MVKVLSAHQPTILPYLGFWRKLALSDAIDLSLVDPFTEGSDYFNHRVYIGDDSKLKFITIPIKKNYVRGKTPMNEIKLNHDKQLFDKNVLNPLLGEYNTKKYRYFKERKQIITKIEELFYCSDNLAQYNFSLIQYLNREYLKINCTILSSENYGVGETTSDRVMSQLLPYQPSVYLSGNSGKRYLELEKWKSNNVLVRFMDEFSFNEPEDIKKFNGASILSYLFSFSLEKITFLLEEASESDGS